MSDEQPGLPDKSEMMEFNDKEETDFSGVLVWIGCVLAIVFLVFIWLLNISLKKEIKTKESEKATAVGTLNLPENQKVVDNVLGVKDVISALSDVATNQDTKKEAIEDLYAYITRDVKISALSISADGKVGLDGNTASYRSVSDLMSALKSYKKVTGLELKSVSLSDQANTNSSLRVAFSLSFILDMTKTAASAPTPATSADTSANDTPADTTSDSESDITDNTSSTTP